MDIMCRVMSTHRFGVAVCSGGLSGYGNPYAQLRTLLVYQSPCEQVNQGSGVAEWARALTGDRTVNGSSLAAVKTFRFASELWQFRLPRLASVFRMRH